MSMTVTGIIENYPDVDSLSDLKEEQLEFFISHLRSLFEENKHLKFPDGIYGLVIYAVLKDVRNMSAQEDDFEYFTKNLLATYQQCYGRLLLEIHNSFPI